MTRTIAVIPARGGSRRVPGKNVRLLAGKPLIVWTIEAALQSNVLDRVIVSTDDQATAGISEQAGAEVPFMRPAELSDDSTPTLAVLQHALKELGLEDSEGSLSVFTLQPTSPLRRASQIAESFHVFESNQSADSLVSVVELRHAQSPLESMTIGPEGFLEMSSRETRNNGELCRAPKFFARNGAAIYITRARQISSFILGGRMLPYMMNPEDSIDIDTEFDFRHAEFEMQFRHRSWSPYESTKGNRPAQPASTTIVKGSKC